MSHFRFTSSLACSRLRDSRTRGIEKARKIKKNGRKLGRGGGGEILAREIWERFQLIDTSTAWQPKSNYLKGVKNGRKRVVKEMIAGSLSLPFPFFPALPPFSPALHFRVFPTIWEPGTGYFITHVFVRIRKQRSQEEQPSITNIYIHI